MASFVNSNENCPISTYSIEPMEGGVVDDFTVLDGSIPTIDSASGIVISMPTTQLVNSKIYKFRVKATATGGAVAFTDNIKIKVTKCENAVITVPSLPAPGSPYFQDTSPGTLVIPGQFETSIEKYCPIAEVYVDTIDGGTPSSFAGGSGGPAAVTSSITDTDITVTFPKTGMLEFIFIFRVAGKIIKGI